MPMPNPKVAIRPSVLDMSSLRLVEQRIVQARKLPEQAHDVVDHQHQQGAAADTQAQKPYTAQDAGQEMTGEEAVPAQHHRDARDAQPQQHDAGYEGDRKS